MVVVTKGGRKLAKSKYEPLKTFLSESGRAEIPMAFKEIEAVIGCKLPLKASGYPAWWSNNPSNNPMTRAWLDAGYESESVDTKNRKLIFRQQIEATRKRHTVQIWVSRETRDRLESLRGQIPELLRPKGLGDVVGMLSLVTPAKNSNILSDGLISLAANPAAFEDEDEDETRALDEQAAAELDNPELYPEDEEDDD